VDKHTFHDQLKDMGKRTYEQSVCEADGSHRAYYKSGGCGYLCSYDVFMGNEGFYTIAVSLNNNVQKVLKAKLWRNKKLSGKPGQFT